MERKKGRERENSIDLYRLTLTNCMWKEDMVKWNMCTISHRLFSPIYTLFIAILSLIILFLSTFCRRKIYSALKRFVEEFHSHTIRRIRLFPFNKIKKGRIEFWKDTKQKTHKFSIIFANNANHKKLKVHFPVCHHIAIIIVTISINNIIK